MKKQRFELTFIANESCTIKLLYDQFFRQQSHVKISHSSGQSYAVCFSIGKKQITVKHIIELLRQVFFKDEEAVTKISDYMETWRDVAIFSGPKRTPLADSTIIFCDNCEEGASKDLYYRLVTNGRALVMKSFLDELGLGAPKKTYNRSNTGCGHIDIESKKKIDKAYGSLTPSLGELIFPAIVKEDHPRGLHCLSMCFQDGAGFTGGRFMAMQYNNICIFIESFFESISILKIRVQGWDDEQLISFISNFKNSKNYIKFNYLDIGLGFNNEANARRFSLPASFWQDLVCLSRVRLFSSSEGIAGLMSLAIEHDLRLTNNIVLADSGHRFAGIWPFIDCFPSEAPDFSEYIAYLKYVMLLKAQGYNGMIRDVCYLLHCLPEDSKIFRDRIRLAPLVAFESSNNIMIGRLANNYDWVFPWVLSCWNGSEESETNDYRRIVVIVNGGNLPHMMDDAKKRHPCKRLCIVMFSFLLAAAISSVLVACNKKEWAENNLRKVFFITWAVSHVAVIIAKVVSMNGIIFPRIRHYPVEPLHEAIKALCEPKVSPILEKAYGNMPSFSLWASSQWREDTDLGPDMDPREPLMQRY